MADQDSNLNSPQPPTFLEVTCEPLHKTTRFAAGTKSGFAVSLINKKLDNGLPPISHIEAFKSGEEPVSFGPDAVLVDYGNGWKLQTVSELDHGGVWRSEKMERIRPIPVPTPNVVSFDGLHPAKTVSQPGFSFVYIGKILLAFILIFVLGAILTLALENLPKLILFINSFM